MFENKPTCPKCGNNINIVLGTQRRIYECKLRRRRGLPIGCGEQWADFEVVTNDNSMC